MDEEEGIELLVVVEDDEELHECTYFLNHNALERWESLDITDPETGLMLVRTLVLIKLREHNESLYQLLMRSCYPAEFINEGIEEYVLDITPRLGLVSSIIDKVYQTLGNAVVELGYRTVH